MGKRAREKRAARSNPSVMAKQVATHDGNGEAPTGHIVVDGEPMAFWLPPGVQPADLNISTTNRETAR